jgi:hypothetical protein
MDWRPVPGFPGYEINPAGKVRKAGSGYELRPYGRSYRLVQGGVVRQVTRAALLALAFGPADSAPSAPAPGPEAATGADAEVARLRALVRELETELAAYRGSEL